MEAPSSKAVEDLLSKTVRPFDAEAFKTFKGEAKLCFDRCSVESLEHPGLWAKDEEGTPRYPTCALPKAFPHEYHLCAPGHVNLYRVCPECDAVVQVRAIRRHLEAHLGLNRGDPKELAKARRVAVAGALKKWLAAYPEWGTQTTQVQDWHRKRPFTLRALVARLIGELRDEDKDGAFWKQAIKNETAELGVVRPPLGVKEIKEGQSDACEAAGEPRDGEVRRDDAVETEGGTGGGAGRQVHL